MLDNVETKELAGSVIFKDGKSFSKIEEQPESLEQIDGCKLLKSVLSKIENEKKDILDLKDKLSTLEKEQADNEKLANELKANGYCAIDYLVTNALSVLSNTYTHQPNCKHKGV